MKNLTNGTLEKMMQAQKEQLKDRGYVLRRGVTHETIEGITLIAQKIEGTKPKKDSRLTKDISFLDERLEERIIKTNIPGIVDLYNRTKGLVDISFNPGIRLEDCTTRKMGKRYLVTLSNDLTTEQQAAYMHEMGHIIPAINKRKTDCYEYRELIPMLVSHLFFANLGSEDRYREESIKRTYMDVKSSTHRFLKDIDRFERFQQLTENQLDSMLGTILDTNTYLSSFEFLLGLCERMEGKDEEKVLRYTASVMTGDKTTGDMAEEFGIDTSNFKRIHKQLGTYKK